MASAFFDDPFEVFNLVINNGANINITNNEQLSQISEILNLLDYDTSDVQLKTLLKDFLSTLVTNENQLSDIISAILNDKIYVKISVLINILVNILVRTVASLF